METARPEAATCGRTRDAHWPRTRECPRRTRYAARGAALYRKRANTPGASLDLERETLHVMDDARRVAMVETKSADSAYPERRT